MTDPNETAAFMRTIIERPDDDLPRLVYADYLDERGEAERAEFIRVQCELARLMLTCPCRGYYCTSLTCDWTSDYGSLRRRERELLNFGTFAWTRWLQMMIGVAEPGRLPDLRWEFHRGFVESITCSWADWQRHAYAIRAATPLRVVRLTRWPGGWPVNSANWPIYPTAADLSEACPGIKFEFSLPKPQIQSRPAMTGNTVSYQRW